ESMRDDAPDQRILLRVGINIGDIIVGAGDIFGDGVNIAARLEGIAQPGGICLSSSAYDQVCGKTGGGAATSTPLSAPHLSIVVLPFVNIGGDPEQDYFVDGVTESLTTDLSRIRGSLVIARHTAFAYRGKAIDLKQIGRE